MLNFLPSSLVGVIAGFLLFVNVLFWVIYFIRVLHSENLFYLAAAAPDNKQNS